MATLLSLPNELLANILQRVGLRNFREDISRLLVCQRWCEIVRETMLLKTVLLFPHNLYAIQDRVYDYDLLGVLSKARDLRISASDAQGDSHHAQSMFLPEERDFAIPARLSRELANLSLLKPEEFIVARDAMPRIVDLVSSFRHIEAFRLRVSDHGTIINIDGERQRPHRVLLESLYRLSANLPASLTTLELELNDNAFAPDAFPSHYGHRPRQRHICHIIGQFLPKLRNLAFHLESTCPEAFHLEDADNMIGLERLLVNMDPYAVSRYHEIGHWNGCSRSRLFPKRHFPLQRKDIVSAGKALVERMKSPRMVRLCFGVGPNTPQLAVVDCITGLEMILPDKTHLTGTSGGEVVEDIGERSAYSRFWDQ
jgi:hypothetical protein